VQDDFGASTTGPSQSMSSHRGFGGDSDEDLDDFGPFSKSADSAMDPFNSPFDAEASFGDADTAFDFGDFQASELKDGESTPTGGGWTWEPADASASSAAATFDNFSADGDFTMANTNGKGTSEGGSTVANTTTSTGSRRSHRREASAA